MKRNIGAGEIRMPLTKLVSPQSGDFSSSWLDEIVSSPYSPGLWAVVANGMRIIYYYHNLYD